MFGSEQQIPFVEAAVLSLLGKQMSSSSYSPEAARSMAYIALLSAACIGYKHPDKVPLIYRQQFGDEGQRIHDEMVDSIQKWTEKEYTGLSDLNDLPILKIAYQNLQREGGKVDKQDILLWAVPAFRYGCVLGASHPSLFRELWTNTKRREQVRFHGLQQAGVSVPDEVARSADSDFDELVYQAAGFLEFYESESGPLPAK